MVRLPLPTINHLPTDSSSEFLSKKHQLLHLLTLCSSLNHVSQIHAQILLFGLRNDSFLLSELIKFSALSPFKNLNYAKTLVNNAENSAPSSWNMVIRGYAASKTPKEAFWLYRRMLSRGIRPNKLTFPFLFKAGASIVGLEEGKQTHGDVLKRGLDSDAYVQNSLINFYGCCRQIFDARKVFDAMCERTVVSWNAAIGACVENRCLGDGIRLFLTMRERGFEADETTMVVVLSACAELRHLSLGKWVHSLVVTGGMIMNCQLGTALVDMYAKCGAVGYARLVFNRMDERNVLTWGAMILGLAQHGFARDSLVTFENMMQYTSIQPNSVTFLGVLCACSHAGLVDEAFRYFYEMEHVHGIKPMMVHYGAMVDTLGRAGKLKEAYNFILDMPIEPDPVVWRTLLSACTIHDVNDSGGVKDMVQKRLLDLEPRRGGNLVMVANMFAEAGLWEKAAKVRAVMKDCGLKKVAGESCIDVGGAIHKFYSGDDAQPDSKDIYRLLNALAEHARKINYSHENYLQQFDFVGSN